MFQKCDYKFPILWKNLQNYFPKNVTSKGKQANVLFYV